MCAQRFNNQRSEIDLNLDLDLGFLCFRLFALHAPF
jgi:hypothetical protein